MKYLGRLDEHLQRIFADDEALYRELHGLLDTEDKLIAHQVAVESGAMVYRDQIGERIIDSTREAIQTSVQACIDQQRVPPELRAEIEDAFAEVIESAIRRARSRPGNGGAD